MIDEENLQEFDGAEFRQTLSVFNEADGDSNLSKKARARFLHGINFSNSPNIKLNELSIVGRIGRNVFAFVIVVLSVSILVGVSVEVPVKPGTAAVVAPQPTANTNNLVCDNCSFLGLDWLISNLTGQAISMLEGFNFSAAQYVLLVGGSLVAYSQWLNGQRHRAVEEAMEKKGRANDLIIQNPVELIDLVLSAFELDRSAGTMSRDLTADDVSKRIVQEMFVYTEIDILEFVYLKSNQGIMLNEYAFRSVQIFISRAQNKKFAYLAQRLVKKGRYNSGFKRGVNTLIRFAQALEQQARVRDT